jgi:hypothetical protein
MRLISLAVVFVALGCSSGGLVNGFGDGAVDDGATSDTNIVTTDSGRPDTRPPPADTNVPPSDAIVVEDVAPGSCNSLANSGPLVTSKSVMGSSPPATGGTISAGLYRLTDVTYYNNGGSDLPSISVRLGLQFSSGTIQSVAENMGMVERGTSTYSTSGSTMNMTETCPGSEPATLRYSASASTIYMFFDLMEAGYSGTLRYTLTK